MIGMTTSARAGVISTGTRAPPSVVSFSEPGRRNFSGTGPAARSRFDSPAGRKRPSGPTPSGNTSYRAGSRAPTIVRAEIRETSRSTERPPKSTTTRRRLKGSPAYDADVFDRRRAAQLLEYVPGRRGIDRDDRRRLRPVAPGEREVGDIDPGRAEERSDRPHDARDIAVADEKNRSFRAELQRQAVHLHHAGIAPGEERGVRARRRRSHEGHANRADVVAGVLVAGRDDRN